MGSSGMRVTRRLVTGAILAAVLGSALAAQERTRESIADKYKWNLADLYPSDAAWRAEKDALAADARPGQGVCRHAGPVGRRSWPRRWRRRRRRKRRWPDCSPTPTCWPTRTRACPSYQGMSDEMTQLAAAVRRGLGVCRAGAADARSEDARSRGSPRRPSLKPYTFALRDVLRRKAHTLSAREEALLAQTLPMAAGAGNIVEHPPQRRPAVADREAGRRAPTCGSTPPGSRPRGPSPTATIAARRWRRSSARSAAIAAPFGTHAEHRRAGRACSRRARATTSRRCSARSTARTSRRRSTRRWSTASTRICRRFTAISRCASAFSACPSCTTTISTRRWSPACRSSTPSSRRRRR